MYMLDFAQISGIESMIKYIYKSQERLLVYSSETISVKYWVDFFLATRVPSKWVLV